MKTVFCHFDQPEGRLRPQHGFNGLPQFTVNSFFASGPDTEVVRDLLAQTASPVIRVTGTRCSINGKLADVPYIFRRADADVSEESNYDFFRTDEYLNEVKKTGKEIIYHLGAPYEYWKPIFNRKPADYEKFAQVCLNIVRHYNEGWANGFHHNIKTWEIWNRADDPQWFSEGTAEDYYRLYEAIAKKIKGAYPHLSVGGPSAAFCGGDNAFLKGFCSYVKEHEVPCDFISWCYYGKSPEEGYRQACEVKRIVKEAGLPEETPVRNYSFNCMEFDAEKRLAVKDVFSIRGAAFDTAFMIAMQKAGMDQSIYYGAEKNAPWNGLFDMSWIRAFKPLYAFSAFGRLYSAGNLVKTEVQGENIYALAGTDGKKKILLASVYEEAEDSVKICFGDQGRKKVYVLDREHDLQQLLETEETEFTVPVEGYTVLLVEEEL